MKGTKKMKGTKEKNDFRGVKITAGLDVHLSQWNVTIYVGHRYFKSFQQPPCAKKLKNYLMEHFPGGDYQTGYESGYFGFHWHRDLEQLGIKNKVLNAADIPTSDKDSRRKNDRVDSKKIAYNLAHDSVEGIYIPSEEQEAARSLVRYRTKVVRTDLTRARQRVKSFLVSKGKHLQIEGYRTPNWSKAVLMQVENLQFDQPANELALKHYVQDLKDAKEKLRRVNRQIVALSQSEEYSQLVKRLRKIPGIGLITTMALITELGQMERFECVDKLCAYVGIVPDVTSSDKVERVKGLTYRANKELRRLLIQAAWVACSRDEVFAQVFHKKAGAKKGRADGVAQKAIVKVCQKLLRVIRAIWMGTKEYEPNYQPSHKAA